MNRKGRRGKEGEGRMERKGEERMERKKLRGWDGEEGR